MQGSPFKTAANGVSANPKFKMFFWRRATGLNDQSRAYGAREISGFSRNPSTFRTLAPPLTVH